MQQDSLSLYQLVHDSRRCFMIFPQFPHFPELETLFSDGKNHDFP